MEQRAGHSLRNPATGEPIGLVREHTLSDLERAMSEARAAQPGWAALPVGERARYARAMAHVLTVEADGICRTIALCTGKTLVDAMSTELVPCAAAAAYYARAARRSLGPVRLRGGSLLFFNKVSRLERVPYGAVGIISPWNYPFSIPFQEVLMALLAGNAVILKVSVQAQPVGEDIARVLKASGLPPGLFHLLHLPRSVAGAAMLEAGIGKLFFTGSSTVGRELMRKAAETLTPVVLELGGNDAMIVLDDADPERSASGALWAGLSNCGQSCAGVERLFVGERIYPEFRERLLRKVAALRVGPETDFDVDIGTLTLRRQREKLEAVIADAVEKGAVVAGRSRTPAVGGADSGLAFPVIVLENAGPEMRAMREEIFGPVLAIQRFRGDEEAVRLANASSYGLTASVWSRNKRRALGVASRLQAGTVTVNDHLMSHGMAHTPWGGFKDSGFGRTHGVLGLLEMTQSRVVVTDWLHRLPRAMWWFPHDRGVYEGLRGAVQGLYGRGPARRLAGAGKAVGLFLRSFRAGP